MRVVNEDVVAGRVEEIDFGFFPFGVGHGSGDADLPLDLLFVEVGNGVPLGHPRQPAGGAGRVQQGGGERSLAGIAVAHHTDVPQILAFVGFHWKMLPKKSKVTQVMTESGWKMGMAVSSGKWGTSRIVTPGALIPSSAVSRRR